MKKYLLPSIVFLLLLACENTETSSESDESKVQTASSEVDPKVLDIISNMSIEEKAGQMTQLNIDVVMVGEVYNLEEPHRLDPAKLKKAISDYHVGSILNCGGHAYPIEQWHEIINGIDEASKNSTNKIPVLYGIDAIHGANYTMGSTLFPQQLAQAATWNPELVKRGAEITAYEVRATGIPWNFSPVLDIARQPLWSRFFETYGEDVYLAKTMTKACINGYEGDNFGDPYHVASCMKHFLGYSIPFSGKDRTPVYMADRQLREIFLPTFQEAIAAGSKTIMINSGEINGIPVHANKSLLTDLLRTELGFTGLAVTDWEDIIKLNSLHKIAPTLKEAVKISINAGIDMSMVPNNFEFTDLLIELIKEGEVPMERIDEAVARIITLKMELGLFKNAAAPSLSDYPLFGSHEHAQASFETALEAVTLLKNDDDILPLSKETKILVTGPAADSYTLLNGAWSRTWQGVDSKYDDPEKKTIYTGLMELGGNKVQFKEGCSLNKLSNSKEALQMAKNVDVIVLCLSELPSTEKPGDIDNLDLDQAQLDYVKLLQKTGKPIVLVLVENRPRIVNEIVDLCQGIIMAYQPGEEGGRALASLIYGDANPSGKLPFTYPRYNGTNISYDHKTTEELDSAFAMNAFNPQWEFGFGMSYTDFEYSNLNLSADTVNGDEIIVKVTIKNSGNREGKEVVQLFVRDEYASITPPVKRLRAYGKLNLQPGESQEIGFSLKMKDLAFVNTDLNWVTEEGDFTITIGNQTKKFYYAL